MTELKPRPFCGRNLLDLQYVLRFSDGGYYAGRNEKYGDMFNKCYGGACSAKKYDYDTAVKLQEHYEKLGHDVKIEQYDARLYLESCLNKIIEKDEANRSGKDIGYSIRNCAQEALKYLEDI